MTFVFNSFMSSLVCFALSTSLLQIGNNICFALSTTLLDLGAKEYVLLDLLTFSIIFSVRFCTRFERLSYI